MFKTFGGEINEKLQQYENSIQMNLPEDYRQFLIETNGGIFKNEEYSFWVEEIQEFIPIDVLFGFHQMRSLCLNTWYQEYEYELLENTTIIGDTSCYGLILLIWQKDWKGIYLWDHCLELENSTEEYCIYKIADNFESFFRSITIV